MRVPMPKSARIKLRMASAQGVGASWSFVKASMDASTAVQIILSASSQLMEHRRIELVTGVVWLKLKGIYRILDS